MNLMTPVGFQDCCPTLLAELFLKTSCLEAFVPISCISGAVIFEAAGFDIHIYIYV